MTLPVRLTSAAVQDLALAERWYLDESPHVLASFEEEIDSTFDLTLRAAEVVPDRGVDRPPRSGAEVPILGLLPDPP